MRILTSATLLSLMLSAQNVLALGGGTKPVPEPGVWALLGAGVVAYAVRRFMKR